MKNRLLYFFLLFSLFASAQSSPWKDHWGFYRFRNHVRIDSILQLSFINAPFLATDGDGNIIPAQAPSFVGGVNGNVQYNNNGTPGGFALWDGHTLNFGALSPSALNFIYGYSPDNHIGLTIQSGSTSGNNNAFFRGISGTGVDTRMQAAGTVGYLGTFSNHPFDIYTNGAQRLRFPATAIGNGTSKLMLTIDENNVLGAQAIPSGGSGSSSLSQYHIGVGDASNVLSGSANLIYNGNTVANGGGTPDALDRYYAYNSGNHVLSTLQSGNGVAAFRALSSGGVDFRSQANASSGFTGTVTNHPYELWQYGTAQAIIDGPIGDGSTTRVVTINAQNKLGSIAIPSGGSGGEANTTSNVGGAVELAKPKSGVNLPFKTLNNADTKGVAISPNNDGNTVDIVNSGYDLYGRARLSTGTSATQTWSFPGGETGIIEVVITGRSGSGASVHTKQSISFNSQGGSILLGTPTIEKPVEKLNSYSGTPTFSWSTSSYNVLLTLSVGGEAFVEYNVTYKISWVSAPN